MKNNTAAFASGCDLWILIDDPNSIWWKEINFSTAFLLSSLAVHKLNSFTNATSNEAEFILKQTEFPKYDFKSKSKILFINTENHFLNRWLCLIEKKEDLQSTDFLNNIKNLRCQNIRFFFETELSTSLKASFPAAEFISDSH
jgi:hypothetical protein